MNIQTPSNAGVSRNTYKQFDVKQQGVILNNSRTNQQTQLGGWIQGNPLLAGGSARIILNEVNSTNPSYLNGYIEVAGQRAQVVIANPAGVTCTDCGFINANRTTLTTGIPIINGGNLDGYRVEGGVITINGLDTSTSDYTDLIAQSIQVNAKIWANELKVTAGTNRVNADHTQITKITTTNKHPTYAIDVAQLGGMYARKITLIGTQDGIGVRHAGEIGASTGNVVITADGYIESSGYIWSKAANVQLMAQGDINHTGVIESANNTKITVQGTVSNQGEINGNNTEINAITLNNLGTGRIYGDHISISATTVNNDDENGTAPVIAARNRLDIGAQTINNNDHALIFSAGDLAIGGALDANRRATGQATTLNNNSATIEALGDINLSVGVINNINQSITTSTRDLAPESFTEYKLNSGSYHAQDKITRYTRDKVEIYNCQATCIEVKTTGDKSDAFTEYNITRTVSETVVDSSDPAKILAGGDLSITADTVENDKSQIIAGGNLTGNIGTLNNKGASGSKITTDTGTAKSYWRKRKKGKDTTRTSETAYNPASVVESISIAPAVYKANTAVLSGGIDYQVPNNNLFTQQLDAPNGFVIETDPAFANYRNWLSSDHLLNALAVDPATTQKRLGDGFYEQKLLREQVATLTGRRFLEGYNNDELQYQQLMQEGALFAQTYKLRLGITLSAEQMAQLTTNIVWLVEKTITLANGETARALVPQLYVYVEEGDLSATGGLIAADNSLNLNMSNDLNNFGSIAGRRIADISAENIHNLGGRLRGDTLSVSARNDLNNIGGRIEAKDRLTVSAGRDLRVESTTSTQQNAQGSRTNINRVAGLYVSGANGLLSASAGRDLILRAAGVQSSGSVVLTADNDIRIETLNTQTDNRVTWDAQNFSREYKSTEIGSHIQSTGAMQIQAGRDISARATQVSSTQGALQVSAARNIEITAGEQMQGLDAASRHTSKGFMSKRTLITRDDIQKTTAQNSSFSRRRVDIQTGQDITLIGSDILTDEGVNLVAGGDINIKSSEQRYINNHQRIEKKSGLMSGGSFGFTLGKRKQTDQIDKTQVTQRSATVGALSGNINITADNDTTIKASDLLARDGDINIRADNVNLEAAHDMLKQDELHKFEQSGITIALSGGIVDTVKTIEQSAERIQETDNDKLKALHAWRIGRVAQDIDGQLNNLENISDDFSDPLNANTNTDNQGKPQSSGVNLSISLGSSKSEQKRQLRQRTALGSSAIAEGDISITARNDQNRQDSGDINAQGALIQGNKVTLTAADDIHLKSAENNLTDDTKSKSSSTGIGISIGSDGLRFFVQASKSRGEINQSNDQYLETLIQAKQTAELNSGSDTTLEGAQVEGNRIIANIGGNLTITSQQDQEKYRNRQQSMGIKVSVGYGGSGPVSADINASKLKADSNYRAVQEQSGLFAGEDGYNVIVGKNTQLVGGAIVSDAKAANNNFSTDSLEVANIQNRASYKVDSKSISISTSSASNGKVGLGGGFANDSAAAQNTTHSAISKGTLAVRLDPNFIPDNTLKRNQQQAHQILDKIFGEDKIQQVQEQVEVTQLFAEEAYRVVGDLYQEQENAQAKVEAARKAYEKGDISKQNLDAFEQSAEDAKGTLPDKAITHALVGGITALLGGGDFIQGATAAGLNEGAAKQLKDQLPEDPLLRNMVASLIGAVAGGSQGAIIAGNADKFNRQLHISRDLNFDFLRLLSEKFNLNIPNHRANIVARDNITDYPQDIRNELGDPVFREGTGYFYIVEDLKIADHEGVDRLHPVVNDEVSLSDFIDGTGNVQIHQQRPDDFATEDAFLRGYIKDMNAGTNNSPKYPYWETAECVINNCSDDFYNSNTAADTRLENANIPVPDTGDFNVPGGFYDRERTDNDRR